MRIRPGRKPLFAQGSTLHIKLVLCLLASLVFLGIENREIASAQRVPFARFVETARRLVSAPSSGIRALIEWAQTQSALVLENRKLREEALMLKGQQLKLEALEQENTRLRGLLDSTFKVGDQVLIAEPLSIGIVPYENRIVVNKGERHGVAMGQAVVDGSGVVGQVLKVTQATADIILITDPSHATPVQVNRTGFRTLAVGTGETDHLDLPYLPGNADVEEGDLLVTSGLDGVFPSGYPVARIGRMVLAEGRIRLVAIPISNLDHNRELLVVRSDMTPLPRIPLTPGNPAEPSLPAGAHGP